MCGVVGPKTAYKQQALRGKKATPHLAIAHFQEPKCLARAAAEDIRPGMLYSSKGGGDSRVEELVDRTSSRCRSVSSKPWRTSSKARDRTGSASANRLRGCSPSRPPTSVSPASGTPIASRSVDLSDLRRIPRAMMMRDDPSILQMTRKYPKIEVEQAPAVLGCPPALFPIPVRRRRARVWPQRSHRWRSSSRP